MSGDAAPAASEESPASGTATDAGASPFARKGDATPAPLVGRRPAIYVVASGQRTPNGGYGTEDAIPAAPVDAGAAPLFASNAPTPGNAADGGGGPVNAPPAASLDAEPFDPSRNRLLVFDDAPDTPAPGSGIEGDVEKPTDDTVVTAMAPPARPRALTAALVGTAAAAAVAAVIAAVSWYHVAERPEPSASPVATASEPTVPGPQATTPATRPATPVAATTVPLPVIDIVRLEPGGAAVIAGRAAPGTALIVLDNERAIGSVTVGESGDWMLSPDEPLTGGNHEIALAVRTGDGTVSVAAPPPGPTNAGATPMLRPAPPAGSTVRYVVQIASVKSEAGATQEWAKLQAALPDLLGGLTPTVDAAALSDRGTFYRIRLGPFDDRTQAHTLCNALNKAGRDCLVVRR